MYSNFRYWKFWFGTISFWQNKTSVNDNVLMLFFGKTLTNELRMTSSSYEDAVYFSFNFHSRKCQRSSSLGCFGINNNVFALFTGPQNSNLGIQKANWTRRIARVWTILNKYVTYETFKSTVTAEGICGSVWSAKDVVISTNEATQPPWRVFISFICSSSMVISYTHFPLPPDITFAYNGIKTPIRMFKCVDSSHQRSY